MKKRRKGTAEYNFVNEEVLSEYDFANEYTTVAKEPDVRMEREKLWKSELLNVLSKINE